MKKILFVLGLMLFLIGCQGKPIVTIEYTNSAQETVVIDYETLQSKMANQDSFLLYVSSSTCTSCQEFRPILLSWITSTNAVVYQIDVSEAFPTNNSLLPYSVTPTLFIVHQGDLKTTYDYIKNTKVFLTQNGFEQALYKIIIRP